MNSNVSRGDVRILGARKFSAENLLGARADRARKSPQTHTPPLSSFRSLVLRYWKKNGRHNLPWRKTRDPYRILVSEVMLQQTQVDRVMPKYEEFLKKFPTIQSLARSSLFDVLKLWSGLGYNRRAKYLRDAAIAIVKKHNGRIPADYDTLVELPCIGDYTARAIRVFAFNEPDVLIETNIRTVLFHHFNFGFRKSKYADSEIIAIAENAAKGQDPREWHSALMDYGAHLKRGGVRTNHRSAHYVKQSTFEGSLRQFRGAILKSLLQKDPTIDLVGRYGAKYQKALDSLVRDGLVKRSR